MFEFPSYNKRTLRPKLHIIMVFQSGGKPFAKVRKIGSESELGGTESRLGSTHIWGDETSNVAQKQILRGPIHVQANESSVRAVLFVVSSSFLVVD